jgi:hypothetical protein
VSFEVKSRDEVDLNVKSTSSVNLNGKRHNSVNLSVKVTIHIIRMQKSQFTQLEYKKS